MYPLPELVQAISDDKRRAAERHQLCAQAYAAGPPGPRRGLARAARLRVRLTSATSRRATAPG